MPSQKKKSCWKSGTAMAVLAVPVAPALCSPVWRPYLIKDIKKLEQLQRQAMKYILNDYII